MASCHVKVESELDPINGNETGGTVEATEPGERVLVKPPHKGNESTLMVELVSTGEEAVGEVSFVVHTDSVSKGSDTMGAKGARISYCEIYFTLAPRGPVGKAYLANDSKNTQLP